MPKPMPDIPARMARLPRDPRGYPIPAAVWRDAKGRPHFTINDESVRQSLIGDDRCPICADRLFRGRWFVGGPGSAFHKRGVYIDPPMHYECARFALLVCPYLAAPNYSKRIDDRTVTQADERRMIFDDPTLDPARPALFVAAMATGQRLIRDDIFVGKRRLRIVRHIAPKRPLARVEYWRAGAMLDPFVGAAEVAAMKLDEKYAEPMSEDVA